MPDPTRETISATQTPALFGVSPYLTRWMLLRHFIHGDQIDEPSDNRMDWGTKMEALVLAQAAEDLHLEVRSNRQADGTQRYVRRGLLGCTRDADIICPDRGPGALETKCVFDFSVWMQRWSGGKVLPREIEIQLQQQCMVGDGDNHFEWGVLAVWVCGEMHYFERKPIPDLWVELSNEAARFFEDVAAKREGNPFGEPVEMPLLARLFAPKVGTALDLTKHPKVEKLAQQATLLQYHATERLSHDKAERAIKAMFKAIILDAEEAFLPYGIRIKQKKIDRKGYTVAASSYSTLDVFVPESAPPVVPAQAENIVAGG